MLVLVILFIIMLSAKGFSANLFTPRLARLRSILDCVITNTTVADIGCDHGILSVALHASKKCNHIHATDLSALAARGAQTLFRKTNLQSKITLDIGFGIQPLIDKQRQVDCLVLAGMGALGAYGILCNDATALFPADDESVTSSNYSLQALDQLGVQQIILQPWPPHIIPLHFLNRVLLSNGWSYHDQRVNKYGRYHHVTTSFIKGSAISIASREIEDAAVFDTMPLVQKYSSARRLSVEDKAECALWTDYLRKQQLTLSSRLEGLDAAQSQEEARRKSELPRILNECIHALLK